MTPDTFKRAMVALYGQAWVGPAAVEFGIRPNKLQRMAAGTERIYPDTGERIRGCLENKTKEIAMLLQDIRVEREVATTVAAFKATVEACPACKELGICNEHIPF